MAKIEWDEKLSLGIKSIDEQHKELLKIINTLLFAFKKDQSEDAINEILTRLREYTVFHFNDEEQYMAEIRYPKLGEHEQEHNKLKKSVKDLQYRRYYKEELGLIELRDLLSEWLLTHILKSDLNIAKYLKGQQQAEPE